MPDAEGTERAEVVDELRMLRAKAYGPGGGLSAYELARLQQLEGWRREPVPEPVTESVPEPVEGAGSASGWASDASIATPHSSRRSAPPGASGARGPGSAAGEFGPATSDASTGSATERDGAATARRRWPVLAAASIALLALGLGLGWAVWGWDSHASALAAAHGDTQAEIEAQQLYDPGTVVPLAEQYGVVVWRADRSDSKELCVIVTAGEQGEEGGHACSDYDKLDDSMWPNTGVRVPEGEDRAGAHLMAALMKAPSGDLIPVIQVWDEDVAGWEAQYTEDELTQLRAVEAAGFEPQALNIIGYDGDTAVWSTWESGQLCVIAVADGGIRNVCAEGAETVSLTVRSDGMAARYVVTQSEMRPPQLTVYKDVDADYYFSTGDDPMPDDLAGGDETDEG